jgi:hypothetical protein
MLTVPAALKILKKSIAELKSEGYQIFNTNIPAELLNNNHKPDNEPEKK